MGLSTILKREGWNRGDTLPFSDTLVAPLPKLPNFSGAERGRHDRIKTVSRSYQHINYTVSTT